MTLANGKDIKSMLINKKTISLFFQLSLTVLILLGAGLAPAQASAQSIPSTGNTYSFSNPNLSSPVRPSPTTFHPPSISHELSAAQKSASTNKPCTLTPSLIEHEGTPQQTEGPYFVNGMPNRSDINQIFLMVQYSKASHCI